MKECNLTAHKCNLNENGRRNFIPCDPGTLLTLDKVYSWEKEILPAWLLCANDRCCNRDKLEPESAHKSILSVSNYLRTVASVQLCWCLLRLSNSNRREVFHPNDTMLRFMDPPREGNTRTRRACDLRRKGKKQVARQTTNIRNGLRQDDMYTVGCDFFER